MARQRRRNMREIRVDGGDPGTGSHLFAARCSGIVELYALHLAKNAPIKATVSRTSIAVLDDLDVGTPDLIGDEPADNFGFAETIATGVNSEILGAERSLWPELYLEWLHHRMLGLARARGWAEAPLESARQGCIDDGLRVDLSGRTQSNSDRSLKARLDLTIDDDGGYITTLNVFDRNGRLVGQTITRRAGGATVWDFTLSSRRLWWGTAATVRTIQGSCTDWADVGVFRRVEIGHPQEAPTGSAQQSATVRESEAVVVPVDAPDDRTC